MWRLRAKVAPVPGELPKPKMEGLGVFGRNLNCFFCFFFFLCFFSRDNDKALFIHFILYIASLLSYLLDLRAHIGCSL